MTRSLNTSSAHGVPGAARVLPHVSASQVKTFRTCVRKWALEKLWYERSPQTPAQAEGQQIHSVNETYLTTGAFPADASPKHVAIVQQAAAAGNLPAPGPGLLIEHEIHLPTRLGLPEMLGYIDLVNARTPPILILDDHKTTSDFKYALSEQELSDDVQMTTYATWGYSKDALEVLTEVDPRWEDGVDEVEVSHIYQHKKQRASMRVAARVPFARVARNWVSICDSVEEMHALALHPPVNPLDIQGNSNSCSLYGGCPHRSTCGVTRQLFNIRINSEKKDMERKTESLKERLARKRAEQAGASAAPAPDDAGLTPPDAAPRTAQEQTAQATAPAPEPPLATQPVETPAPAPAKRGRPRKAAAPAPAEVKPNLAALETADPDFIGAITKAAAGGPMIFVDCVCAGGTLPNLEPLRAPVALETWLRGIADEVAAEFGVSHVGLIEYGKGKAALAAGIKIAMESGLCPSFITVDTRIPGADVFLEVASAKAALIVKGCR